MSGQPQPENPKPTDAPAQEEIADDTVAQEGAAATDNAEAEPGSGEPITEVELIAFLEKERVRQETEIGELKDQILRAHAEMQNVRKRSEKEKADASKYAITKFALDVVTIADNLARAMDAAGDPKTVGEDVKGVYDGVALTAQELEKSLAKNGVKRIQALGGTFDPHLHQAMMEQPDPDKPSGTILQVFQEGYMVGERVLRPSMVVVARGGPKPARDAGASQPDKEQRQARRPNQAPDADPAPITPDDDPN